MPKIKKEETSFNSDNAVKNEQHAIEVDKDKKNIDKEINDEN